MLDAQPSVETLGYSRSSLWGQRNQHIEFDASALGSVLHCELNDYATPANPDPGHPDFLTAGSQRGHAPSQGAHEAVFRYEEFLNGQNRKEESFLLVETAAQTNPGDKRLRQHAEKLKENQ